MIIFIHNINEFNYSYSYLMNFVLGADVLRKKIKFIAKMRKFQKILRFII